MVSMKNKKTDAQDRTSTAMDRQDAFRKIRAMGRRLEGRTPTADQLQELERLRRQANGR